MVTGGSVKAENYNDFSSFLKKAILKSDNEKYVLKMGEMKAKLKENRTKLVVAVVYSVLPNILSFILRLLRNSCCRLAMSDYYGDLPEGIQM